VRLLVKKYLVVAHLFTMLPQAAEAEKKLEALLTDPKWASSGDRVPAAA